MDNFKPDLMKYRNVRQLGSVIDVAGEITNVTPLFIADLLEEKSPNENPGTKIR